MRTRWLPLLLLAACGSPPENTFRADNPHDGLWQHAEDPAVRLVLEQIYGREDGAEDEMLGFVRHVSVDSEGNMYLFDGGRLKSFSPDGHLRWAVGQEGEGPGEFHAVRGAAFNQDDVLHISNQSGTQLDLFETSGGQIGSIPLSRAGHASGSIVGFLDDGLAAFGFSLPNTFANGIRTMRVGEALTQVDTTVADHTGDRELPGMVSVGGALGVAHGRIYSGLITEYGYSVFDKSLGAVREVRRAGIPFLEPYLFRRGGSGGVMMMSSAQDVLPLDEGRWLGGASWPIDYGDLESWVASRLEGTAPPTAYDRTLDLFSEDGQLLYSVDDAALDSLRIRSVLASNGRDRIYATMRGPTPTLGRLRVEITVPAD